MRTAMLVILLSCSGCGTLTTQGTAPVYLVVDAFEVAGADGQFSGELQSDVVTIVNGTGVPVSDVARVTFSLALKDPGPGAAPNQPSPGNAVTVDRYRVRYIRADGRNTPGVDVPFGFDGALTLTVSGRAATMFSLVRAQAKSEPPLAALSRSPVIISTIAEVTFYGRDQNGRALSVPARMNVHFGNWADPQ